MREIVLLPKTSHTHYWKCDCGLTFWGDSGRDSGCSLEGCPNPASWINAIAMGGCGHALCKIHENGPCPKCAELARR